MPREDYKLLTEAEAERLVEVLNDLARRFPRVMATLAMHTIKASVAEFGHEAPDPLAYPGGPRPPSPWAKSLAGGTFEVDFLGTLSAGVKGGGYLTSAVGEDGRVVFKFD